jgi:hypothetical protein
MTASVKVHLDVDCLFASASPSDTEYARLRQAYDHLTLAIKYASDIGSLRRELLEENNLNSVRILAAEAGVWPLSRLVGSDDECDGALRSMSPMVEEVKRLAEAHLEKAREISRGVPAIDTSRVLDTVSKIVRPYARGEDPFFESQRRPT